MIESTHKLKLILIIILMIITLLIGIIRLLSGHQHIIRGSKVWTVASWIAAIIHIVAILLALYLYNVAYRPQNNAANRWNSIPEEVLTAAMTQVNDTFNSFISYENEHFSNCNYDNWRISSLSHVKTYSEPEFVIDIYRFGYEFHAKSGNDLTLESGMYICDDDWVGGGTDMCGPFLLYLQTKDESKIIQSFISDGFYIQPSDTIFYIGLCRTILLNGLKKPSDFSAQDLFLLFHSNNDQFFEDLSIYPPSERKKAWEKMTNYLYSNASEEDLILFNQDMSNINAGHSY